MICGLQCVILNIFFKVWQPLTGISFSVAIDEATGEIKGRRHRDNPNNITYTHTGYFRGYELTVLETRYFTSEQEGKVVYNLIIEGSLHKAFFGNNYQRFTYANMQAEIYHLCISLHLNPASCIIQNIEIGVNLLLALPVSSFIFSCILMYSTTPFENYTPDSNGLVLGRFATLSQYRIKIYDKGKQYGLTEQILRYEMRCVKMQCLAKYGINTLADLMNYQKVRELANILLITWDKVLLCDDTIPTKQLNISQNQLTLLRDGRNRDFWVRLHGKNKKQFNKQRQKFRELTAAHSKVDTHALLHEMIKSELNEIFK
jgi:hypothetical protein